jgi:hypothetical protein
MSLEDMDMNIRLLQSHAAAKSVACEANYQNRRSRCAGQPCYVIGAIEPPVDPNDAHTIPLQNLRKTTLSQHTLIFSR